MIPAPYSQVSRRAIGKKNKSDGKVAENRVRELLFSLGFKMVERREVGWTVLWSSPMPGRPRRIKNAFPMAKVSGDFTAVAPGARYVHVEVKRSSDPADKLSLGAFQKDGRYDRNQILALESYAALGCLALVAWVTPHGIALMQWPIPGLAPGKPLPWDAARSLNLTAIPDSPTPANIPDAGNT